MDKNKRELKKVNIDKLKPYENNPRYNTEAIDIVIQSIKQCGYVAPIIVDVNYNILAGHTRYQALKRLGETEVEVLIIIGLSEEQKKKYRLLDNRVAEYSEWDFDKLETELSFIDFKDFNFDFDDYIFKPESEYLEDDYDEEDEVEEIKEDKIKPVKKKFYTCPHCNKEFEV